MLLLRKKKNKSLLNKFLFWPSVVTFCSFPFPEKLSSVMLPFPYFLLNTFSPCPL